MLLFEFKSKDKYERKMLNTLKRNFKRKIYMQVKYNVYKSYFPLEPADEQMIKQRKKVEAV